jgi:hypothetical protein
VFAAPSRQLCTPIPSVIPLYPTENFPKFLEKFFSEKKFQTTRIVFPLTYSSYDPDAPGEMTRTTVAKANWRFMRGLKDQPDDLWPQIKERTEMDIDGNMMYSYKGPYDISMTFIFKPVKGKWFLIEIQNGF